MHLNYIRLRFPIGLGTLLPIFFTRGKMALLQKNYSGAFVTANLGYLFDILVFWVKLG